MSLIFQDETSSSLLSTTSSYEISSDTVSITDINSTNNIMTLTTASTTSYTSKQATTTKSSTYTTLSTTAPTITSKSSLSSSSIKSTKTFPSTMMNQIYSCDFDNNTCNVSFTGWTRMQSKQLTDPSYRLTDVTSISI
jgi:hypothetical protein